MPAICYASLSMSFFSPGFRPSLPAPMLLLLLFFHPTAVAQNCIASITSLSATTLQVGTTLTVTMTATDDPPKFEVVVLSTTSTYLYYANGVTSPANLTIPFPAPGKYDISVACSRSYGPKHSSPTTLTILKASATPSITATLAPTPTRTPSPSPTFSVTATRPPQPGQPSPPPTAGATTPLPTTSGGGEGGGGGRMHSVQGPLRVLLWRAPLFGYP